MQAGLDVAAACPGTVPRLWPASSGVSRGSRKTVLASKQTLFSISFLVFFISPFPFSSLLTGVALYTRFPVSIPFSACPPGRLAPTALLPRTLIFRISAAHSAPLALSPTTGLQAVAKCATGFKSHHCARSPVFFVPERTCPPTPCSWGTEEFSSLPRDSWSFSRISLPWNLLTRFIDPCREHEDRCRTAEQYNGSAALTGAFIAGFRRALSGLWLRAGLPRYTGSS